MNMEVSLTVLMFWIGMADSLKCHKCLDRQGNCTQPSVEVCNPHQDACFFEIKQFMPLRASTTKQGCGTSGSCRRYSGGFKGSLHRMMYCCTSDLCKPVTYYVGDSGSKNSMECQSCIGSPAECGQKARSESCHGEETKCVQISQRFLPGEELEPIIKGCGRNSFHDMLVAYQIENNFAFVEQRVCKESNCNNRSFPDIPSGKPNGLKCYTCRDSGHGECAQDRLQILTCTGVMDQCVHVINRDDRTTTIQKGCATETMCGTTAYREIYHNLMRQDSFAQCCKGSLCNRAAGPSGPEMVVVVTMALVSLLALMLWKGPELPG